MKKENGAEQSMAGHSGQKPATSAMQTVGRHSTNQKPGINLESKLSQLVNSTKIE
ncbi:MAG: hypothetical protein R2830_15660 [Saprospiraceae bacterium]